MEGNEEALNTARSNQPLLMSEQSNSEGVTDIKTKYFELQKSSAVNSVYSKALISQVHSNLEGVEEEPMYSDSFASKHN